MCGPGGVMLVNGGRVRPHRAALRPAPQAALRSSAQTRHNRIAVYMRIIYRAKEYPSAARDSVAEDAPIWQALAKDGPIWEGRLFDVDTLPDANKLPEDKIGRASCRERV